MQVNVHHDITASEYVQSIQVHIMWIESIYIDPNCVHSADVINPDSSAKSGQAFNSLCVVGYYSGHMNN